MTRTMMAELAVLGACLIDADALPKVAGKLDPGAFHDERNLLIWAAMVRLNQKARAVDVVTVAAELGPSLEAVGGMDYMAAILDAVPTAVNVEDHAAILSDARRRAVAGLTTMDLIEAARAEVGKLEALTDQIERAAYAGDSERVDALAGECLSQAIVLGGAVGAITVAVGA